MPFECILICDKNQKQPASAGSLFNHLYQD